MKKCLQNGKEPSKGLNLKGDKMKPDLIELIPPQIILMIGMLLGFGIGYNKGKEQASSPAQTQEQVLKVSTDETVNESEETK